MPQDLTLRNLEWVDPNEIDFGLRHRENYGDLTELVADVTERNLISPVAIAAKAKLSPEELETFSASDPEKPFLLMAGGRRTKAALEAGLPSIPAQIFDHVPTELEFRIIELHENTVRKDLDWGETVKLRAKIHDLMIGTYGEKNSTLPDAPGVSLRDAAKAMDVSAATLSIDRKLASAMETMPELEAANTRSEAIKIYDAVVRKLAKEELVRRFENRKALDSAEQLKKAIMSRYKLGDFFVGVKEIRDRTIRVVEIDPPFAIDLKETKREGKTDDYNEVPAAFYENFMRATLNESYRCMADHAWLIVWFAPDPWFEPMAQWIEEAGKPEGFSREEWLASDASLKLRRTPLIWTKRNGQTNQPNYHLANAAEFAFYARKGNPGIGDQGRINVFEYGAVDPKKKIHPTERPIEMIDAILGVFGRTGAQVMTPFAGSGNTILAAMNSNMPVIGWDLSAGYKKEFDARVLEGDPTKKWKSY